MISRLGVMNSPGMNESKIRKEDKKVRSAAIKFARAMDKDYVFAASMANMLWFAVFKAMSSSHRRDFPADFEYYSGKHFFTETELNVMQRSIISIFTNFFRFLIRMGMV